MQLRSLYLKNFRIYEEASFEFGSRINMICGGNAIGKTDNPRSPVRLNDRALFSRNPKQRSDQTGTAGFYIEASFVKHGIAQTLKFAYEGKRAQNCLQ